MNEEKEDLIVPDYIEANWWQVLGSCEKINLKNQAIYWEAVAKAKDGQLVVPPGTYRPGI